MKDLDKILAEYLLKISAIKLQPEHPFTWASGWNSPIYTDNPYQLVAHYMNLFGESNGPADYLPEV